MEYKWIPIEIQIYPMNHLKYIQITPNLIIIFYYLKANAGLKSDYPSDDKIRAAPNPNVTTRACSNLSSENFK